MKRPRTRLGLLRTRRRGFAILMVVLVLVGLAIIAAPFAISMRREEQASANFAARIRAKLAARGALNWAIAQLERTHEHIENWNAESTTAGPTVFNSPYVDANGEFRVDFEGLTDIETANPTGVMWGATVRDEQCKVNLKTASQALLRNLLRQLFAEARANAIAKAIIPDLDTDRHQFTTLTQIREVDVDHADGRVSAAEFDRMAAFLTVHSASLVGDVPNLASALHPVNANTCPQEVLRALLTGIRLAKQDEDQDQHPGVDAAEVQAIVECLRPVLTLDDTVSQDAAEIGLTSTAYLPKTGWISIEGDAIRYTKKDDTTLTVVTDPPCGKVDEDHPHQADTPLTDVPVRLLLTDVENDLANALDLIPTKPDPLDSTAPYLYPDSRSAILANAVNPLDDAALDLTTTTAPLCFCSFNIYTVESYGIASAADGRELARYTVREVVQVAPAGDLEIRIETQDDFQRSVQGGNASHVATWPNACQVSDVPPQHAEPVPATSAQYLFRRGRLGLQPAEYSPAASTSFVARFDGPLKRNVLLPDEGSRMRTLDSLTTVEPEPGDDGDLEPEGIHVGENSAQDEKRILVYPARNDANLGLSNIPHSGPYVSPFILSMWMKFDPKNRFDYARDHFFFDLAETTFTNRIALYYDGWGKDKTEGDLILRVCDATLQNVAAQVRHHIDEDTFEPERWYHIAAVVKGLGYNQLALLINGRSVGTYEPSGNLGGDIDSATNPILAYIYPNYVGKSPFAPFDWPREDCAYLGGELVNFEYVSDPSTDPDDPSPRQLAGCARGARSSQARAHGAGTRLEIFGYENFSYKSHDQTEYPDHPDQTDPGLNRLLTAADVPKVGKTIPERMATAEIDDGTSDTAEKTNEFWKPDELDTSDPPQAEYYQAAKITDNEIPVEDWIPIANSKTWTVDLAADATAEPSHADTEAPAAFKEVAEDKALLAFLHYGPQPSLPDTGKREVKDTDMGLGFLRVVENKDENDVDQPGESIKYTRVGAVLVWRYNEDKTAKIAWYIGYLAGLTRGCFETEQPDLMEGAKVRFDCLRLDLPASQSLSIARGHREHITWTFTPDVGPPIDFDVQRSGSGLFQVYAGRDQFEWIVFTHPAYYDQANPQPKAEWDLLAQNRWLVGISRSTHGTGNPAHENNQVGLEFLPASAIMPVLFGSGTPRMARDDNVTLTDVTKSTTSDTQKPEPQAICHVTDHLFSFHNHIAGEFRYANWPRILKFPSGELPARPDNLMFLGSDSDFDDQWDPETGASPITDPAEPERPANATFDEIKIYPTGDPSSARLWDFHSGPPTAPALKDPRWVKFINNDDILDGSVQPPFTIRIGHLERITPQPSDPAVPNEPFRFEGDAGWPMEGYLKIDDECMFYRKMYSLRNASHSSAEMIIPKNLTPDPASGYVQPFTKDETADQMTIYINYDKGAQFPEQGYITYSSSTPNKDYYDRALELANNDPIQAAALAAWLRDPANNANLYTAGGGLLHRTPGGSSGEYLFYDHKEPIPVDNPQMWRLHIKHRAMLNSSAQAVKVLDPDQQLPTWYYSDAQDVGSASVSLVAVEFLILQRGCLGTDENERHAVGAAVMQLEHIPTSLTPRAMVKLERDLDTGLLLRDGDGHVKVLPDDSTAFKITKPEYEYGLVVEDTTNFPLEGYVQIGDETDGYETLGYIQERSDDKAKVPIWDQAAQGWVERLMPILTGFKHFRQRYGSPRAKFLEYGPDASEALKKVDPGIPDSNRTTPATFNMYTQNFYWADLAKHIVRAREFRYHDRHPQVEPAAPDDAEATYVGLYAPHRDDSQLGYYEFAITMPGTTWTRVLWSEVLYRKINDAWTFSNDPLADDPYDVKVLVQVDGAPAWSDETPNAATSKPVATPIPWEEFPVSDAYDSDASSHRTKRPVIHLFDDAYDPDDQANTWPHNYINPYKSTALVPRGQLGDRICLRVVFQYRKTTETVKPDYDVPWRTPWVDTIRIKYKAPTYVFEHHEVPY